jgi:hypothetical protein
LDPFEIKINNKKNKWKVGSLLKKNIKNKDEKIGIALSNENSLKLGSDPIVI